MMASNAGHDCFGPRILSFRQWLQAHDRLSGIRPFLISWGRSALISARISEILVADFTEFLVERGVQCVEKIVHGIGHTLGQRHDIHQRQVFHVPRSLYFATNSPMTATASFSNADLDSLVELIKILPIGYTCP